MTKTPINLEEVRSDLIKLGFDENLAGYKHNLLTEIDSNRLVVLKNQFFYIMDMQNFQIVFVHKNIEASLGYKPEHFKSLSEIFSVTHPDDHDFVLAFAKKTISFSREPLAIKMLLSNPFNLSFSIDFRIRKADNSYIRVLRETSCIKLDKKGNMIFAIALFTDISHLKHKNYISCSCTGDETGLFNTNDIKRDFITRKFTDREIEIIRLLAEGKDGREIAGILTVSEHTVIAHRKNVLRKAGVCNTAELVKYAIEFGII